MDKGEKVINMAIPAELHRELKTMAAQKETTVKELVVRALQEYCRKNK
jgi:hypothetical protein